MSHSETRQTIAQPAGTGRRDETRKTSAAATTSAAQQRKGDASMKTMHKRRARRACWVGLALLAAGLLPGAARAQDVSATGGTVTKNGGYRIHTFTSSGTLEVTTGGNVEVLVVAGGGGSGGVGGQSASGAGGAGGFVTQSVLVAAGSHTVTVGNGGAGGANTGLRGSQGGNSSVFSITAIGGGGGGGGLSGHRNGGSGGSGGGGGGGDTAVGGAGTAGQGTAGGAGQAAGGGAGVAGSESTENNRSRGLQSRITGSAVWYAGGG